MKYSAHLKKKNLFSFKLVNSSSDAMWRKGYFTGNPIINFWVPPSLSSWGLIGFSFSSSNLPRRSATQTVLPFFISLYFSSHLYNRSYFITAVIVRKREKTELNMLESRSGNCGRNESVIKLLGD